MERKVWKGRIKSGCEAEYIKRHDEIWPELVETLKKAGICNYTIFISGSELFGYYECEKGIAFVDDVKSKSDVVARWNEYMKDILEVEIDSETGSALPMLQVFRMD